MWSDPEEIDAWAVSPRGAGWLFGAKVAMEFNHINGMCITKVINLVGKIVYVCIVNRHGL